MSLHLPPLLVRIIGDNSSAIRQLEQVRKAATGLQSRVGAGVDRLNRSMAITAAAAATSVGAAGAAMVSGFGAATDEYAKFNLALTKSTSIMNVNAEMTEELKKQTYDLALKGPHAPNELAKAYYYLASAGLDAASAMKTLPVIQRFAIAGDVPVEEATSLAMNTMSAMGMRSNTGNAMADAAKNAANLARITDVLVQANILADGTTKQFAQSLIRQAGPAMRAFGKDVEEAVAMAMTMADQGDKGITAGTHMSMMLRHISQQSVKREKVWKQQGIDPYDSKGNLKHVADIAQMLFDKFDPMSDKERTGILTKMGFEAKLQQGLFPLLGKAQQFKRYDEALRGKDTKGVAERVMGKQMTAFTNQMIMAGNAIKIMAIEVGETLAPAFLGLGQALFGVVDWFRQLDKGMIGAVATVGMVTGAVLTFTGSLLAAGAAIIALYTFIGGTGLVAVGAILAGVTAIGVAAGAVIVGMGGWGEAWKTVTGYAEEFWTWLEPIRGAVFVLAQSIMKTMPYAWDFAKAAAEEAWYSMGGGNVNWKNARENFQNTIIFMSYWLENFGEVNDLVWAGVKHKSAEAINSIVKSILPFATAMSIIAPSLAPAFSALQALAPALEGTEKAYKAEFDRLQNTVGTESDKWKSYLEKKKQEIKDMDFFRPDKKSSEQNINEWVEVFKKFDQRFRRAFNPADHAEKQAARIEQALFGSVEYYSRMQEQFDRLYLGNGLTAAEYMSGKTAAPSQEVEEQQLEVLKEIRQEIAAKVNRSAFDLVLGRASLNP